MDRVELKIYYKEGNEDKLRCTVNRWKFQDHMMGEQFITFNITSEIPIDFAVGDFCQFRGETYTLNYIPSVTQKARSRESQDSFTYESVKFESFQEELTRCILLDITPTTGTYIAALGTNHTGSSRFQLFCGETIANGNTLTSVCALAAKIQANLDRMYGANTWSVLVDTIHTYTDSSGKSILVTHTEDKVLSFDNTTVAKALEEVHNTFDLDYCIRGRRIYIGYTLNNLTSDNDNETFAFGYGMGYPTHDDQNKALFQIKKIANSQQKVVTRLRALGSTKNMPYRYYNKQYGGSENPELSQTLFPTNLQLPDTFIPEGTPDDVSGASTKWGHNKERKLSAPYLRAVKGDTNDSYIEKNDNASACAEGIREESARWDGSNGDLQEIYPTIENATYAELRGALVEDQDGKTGGGSFANYEDDERIDSILAVGYWNDGSLVDDANKGDGILPESGVVGGGVTKSVVVGSTTLKYNGTNNDDFEDRGNYYAGQGTNLFSVLNVSPGQYVMVPTGASYDSVIYGFCISAVGVSVDVGFLIEIKKKSKATGIVTTVTYTSDFVTITKDDGVKEVALPELPDVKNDNPKITKIEVDDLSDVVVSFTPIIKNIIVSSGTSSVFDFTYWIGSSQKESDVSYPSEYTWKQVDASGGIDETFHVFVKDMGFDITACWADETPVVSMKSGRCVGREFEICENVQKVKFDGKKGYMLTLKRATDSSLNTYYPSATDPIAAGDYFVLLNISMPDVYVKTAEVRLLKAATDYLADNSETAFTYQPYIDDIYLQRNYDNMVAEGTPEKSIFWRLYAGLKFTFRGIPKDDESPLPFIDITIAQVSIQMGDGLTPKVEITLNDDIQQTTLQKLTIAVDRIYNGSLFSSGAGGGSNYSALLNLLRSEGARMFLSKTKEDAAAGIIEFLAGLQSDEVATFVKGLVANGIISAQQGETFGNFVEGLYTGSGARVDALGNAEVESLRVRTALEVLELIVNRLSAIEGDQILTESDTVESIEELGDPDSSGNAVYRLHLKDKWDGYLTAQYENNVLKGIFNSLPANAGGISDISASDSREFDGGNAYFTSWMRILPNGVHAASGHNWIDVVLYTDSSTPAGKNYPPCPMMRIARWGNCGDTEVYDNDDADTRARKAQYKHRQSCLYLSSTEGRIVKLKDVNKPVVENWMYGFTLGIVPDFLLQDPKLRQLIDPERDYAFFDGIITRDILHYDKQGKPLVTHVAYMEWEDEHRYYFETVNEETGVYETSDVYHNGCKWSCLVNQPRMVDGVAVYDEPGWNSPSWLMIEGNAELSMRFYTPDGMPYGDSIATRPSQVNIPLVPHVFFGYEDISDRLGATSWSWSRSIVPGAWTNPSYIDSETGEATSDSTRSIRLTGGDMPGGWGTTGVSFTCTVDVGGIAVSKSANFG